MLHPDKNQLKTQKQTMTKKLFIAATNKDCGKTTISLALMHRLREKYGKVGFFKPVGQIFVNYKGIDMDKDAALMAEVFGFPEEDLQWISPIVIKPKFTQEFLNGDIIKDFLIKKINTAYNKLSSKYDYLIIEGTGHGGVGSVLGLSNAVIASMLDAPVVIISMAGIGRFIDQVSLNLALYEKEGVEVVGVMPNKIKIEKREKLIDCLSLGFKPLSLNVIEGFQYRGRLQYPTWQQIGKLFGKEMRCIKNNEQRLVRKIQIAAAATKRMLEILSDDSILVIPSTRDEMIISMVSLYKFSQYRKKIAGIILSGEPEVYQVTNAILNASDIPYFKVINTSIEVFDTIRSYNSKISASETNKIELINQMSEEQASFDQLLEVFE